MHNLKNKVQLIGHLGSDPDIKDFSERSKMAKLSLATNDLYSNNEGEKVEETQWHNIVAWGKLAKVCEDFLVKGSEVIIQGKLTHRQFEDKEKVKRNYTEVLAQEIYVIGQRKL